ncbi:MAG: T9SS type A sorting domain-containing protein, partial [Bacteroidales bacterium]|nr:T9SS type A sorting domain-containing protein [Bacteroidales bacterium]
IIPGVDTEYIIAREPGYYSVIAANDCFEASSSPVRVNMLPSAVPALTISDDSLNVCREGAKILQLSGDTNLTKQWLREDLIIPNAIFSKYNADETGVYSIKTTHKYGCAKLSEPVAVSIEKQLNPVVTAYKNTTICPGDTLNLFTNKEKNLSYQWKRNNIIIEVATNNTYIADTAGIFSVTVSDSSGCVETSNALDINYFNSVVPSIYASNNAYICKNNPVSVYYSDTLIENFETGDFSKFKWKLSSWGWNVNNNLSYDGNYSSFILTGGDCPYMLELDKFYPEDDTISFYYNYKCWEDINSFYFLINDVGYKMAVGEWALASFPVKAGWNNFKWQYSFNYDNFFYNFYACIDYICFSSKALRSFLWQKDGADIPGTTGLSAIKVNEPGNYSLKIKNACDTATSQIIKVTGGDNPDSVLTILNDSTELCLSNPKILKAVNNSTYKYQWYKDKKVLPADTLYYLQPKTKGKYFVVISDPFGCTSTSAINDLTLTKILNASITAENSLGFCKNDSVLLKSSAPFQEYQWLKNNLPIQGASNSSLLVKDYASYSLIVKDKNQCVDTSNILKTFLLKTPAPYIYNEGKTAFCKGANTSLKAVPIIYETFTSNSFKQYNWINDSLRPWTIVDYYGYKDKYSVKSGSIPNNSKTELNLNLNLLNNDSLSFYYDLNTYTDYGYFKFYINDSLILSQTGSYDWTKVSFPVKAGSVNLKWVFLKNDLYTDDHYVYIDNIIIGASASWQYQWLKNDEPLIDATSSNYTVTETGSYSYIASNNCGSATSQPVFIEVFDLPEVSIDSSHTNSPPCYKNPVILKAEANTATSCKWYKDGFPAQIKSSFSYNPVADGLYKAVVTDKNNCINTSNSITIKFLPSLVAEISPKGNKIICDTSSLTLTAANQPGFNYSWLKNGVIIPAATSSSYTASQEGSYRVIISDNLCSDSSDAVKVLFKSKPIPDFIIDKAEDNYCTGNVKLFSSSLFFEGFESNDFNKYKWVTFGAAQWTIDKNVYKEGKYSAKAPFVSGLHSADLSLALELSDNDTIAFFFKISSEKDFDFLNFYINDSLAGQWSGEINWTEARFKVYKGINIFKWSYARDGAIASGSNTAWIDNIYFTSKTHNANATYAWLIDDKEFSKANSDISPTQQGYYKLKLNNNCNTVISKPVYIFKSPVIKLDKLIKMCENTDYTIDAGEGFKSYFWSTGDTTRFINVNSDEIGNGSIEYTLAVVDYNGCKTVFNGVFMFILCNSINDDNTALLDLSIIPNPSSGLIKISFSSNTILTDEFNLAIINMQGVTVFNSDLILLDSKQKTIDLSTVAKGLYYVRFKNKAYISYKKLMLY